MEQKFETPRKKLPGLTMVNLVTLKRGNHKGRDEGLGGFFKSEPLSTQGSVEMLKMNETPLSLPGDRSEGKIINFGGIVQKQEGFCLMKNS